MEGLAALKSSWQDKADQWRDYLVNGNCSDHENYILASTMYATLTNGIEEIAEIERKLRSGE